MSTEHVEQTETQNEQAGKADSTLCFVFTSQIHCVPHLINLFLLFCQSWHCYHLQRAFTILCKLLLTWLLKGIWLLGYLKKNPARIELLDIISKCAYSRSESIPSACRVFLIHASLIILCNLDSLILTYWQKSDNFTIILLLSIIS